MKKIYMDNNATTPVHPEVVKEMGLYYSDVFGNPSSVHAFGRKARDAVEKARGRMAEFIGAKPEEIVFTSGGTEADNLAIKGTAYAGSSRGKHIITSAIEHHAVLNPCKHLEKQGFEVTYLPVDKAGLVDPQELEKAIRPGKTILITIMLANNETGTIEPVSEIGRIAKEKGVYFHTDAVQGAGKLELDVNGLNADLLSLSGHKFYGPKGIGALYIRKGTRIQSLLQGGHHEKNKRAGTENVAGICGFAKAAEIASSVMDEESEKLLRLRDRLYKGITGKIDDVHLNGHPEKRLCNTLNVSFQYIEGESVVLNLDLEGVAVSTGSACTSGTLEPSHVLGAMGIEAAVAQGSIRFSLGRDNTEEEIDYVINILPEIVSRLRSMSPLYKKKK